MIPFDDASVRRDGQPQTVLVTGGSGFIGKHLVSYLRERGFLVRTFGRRPLGPDTEHVPGDIRDNLADAARGCSCVVHLAGLSDASVSMRSPAEFASVNVLGTIRALEAAREHNAAFVLASSQRVYRPAAWRIAEDAPLGPIDPYGETKRQAEAWTEQFARLSDVRATILRLFSVYGPGQVPGQGSGVVAIFLHAARQGQPLRVRARQFRDFVDVRDVCRAIELAVERPADGVRICNVGTGQATSIADLAEMVREVVGRPVPLVLDMTPGAESYVADPRYAAAELEFESRITLAEGLRWYAQHCDERSR
ncbi:MAG TPA: NAD(P)-dependent oxidoreductase [Chloroflexota bacterium]|nr:NAD(P)-dependent oxidoreductase [Chloroflexota bacterium]